MKITIDDDNKILKVEGGADHRELPLYSDEAFGVISKIYLKVGWNQKYSYTFTWLGRPIVQLPDDMVRLQELIYRIRPDVIIETGVAHGGSLIYYASLCQAMGGGRVIGIDIEIRPKNRKAIETHTMSGTITLIEGNSAAPEIVAQARALVGEGQRCMVVLDSDHSYKHVLAELEAYAPLVTPGSYIVVTDGIMRDLYDVPRGAPGWAADNPAHAAEEFAQKHPEFILEQPAWAFNDSTLSNNVTYWPSAYLRRAA